MWCRRVDVTGLLPPVKVGTSWFGDGAVPSACLFRLNSFLLSFFYGINFMKNFLVSRLLLLIF